MVATGQTCFEIIVGTDTITTHHEFGFTYRLDVRTVFFDPTACI